MVKPDRNDHIAMIAHARWFARRIRRGTYRRPEPPAGESPAPAPLSARDVMGPDAALELKVKTKGERINGRETPRERL